MATTASTLNVLQRLSLVEGRLARLESLFLLAPPPVEHREGHPIAVAEPARQAAVEPAPTSLPAAAAGSVVVQPQRFDVERHPDRVSAKVPAGVEEAPRRPGLSLESLVGGRFFAVLGALGTVIGLALFLKLAYDEGWLGRIGPVWRCLCGAATGVGLLVAGEIVRKRLGAWASAGISAAGVAALYASGFAAFALFDLVTAWAAFMMLAGISVIGIVIGARSRMPALSVVSFVGAYLVPLLLNAEPASSLTRPAYLLALLAGGMTLASWLRGGFRVVGAQVFLATIPFGAWAVQSVMRPYPEVAIGFIAAVWSVVHASLLFATRQRFTDGDEQPVKLKGFWRAGVLLASFLATAWSVGLGIIVLRAATGITDWLAPLGGVGATALLAIGLCGHLRLFIERPRTEREYLGAALLTQAGGLLIGVIAMAASGSTQLYLWLGLGVGAALAGRWTGSRAMTTYAIVLLSIATLRVGTIEAVVANRLPVHDVFDLMLTEWSLHCALAAAGWLALAAAAQRRSIVLARVAIACGLTLLAVCVLHPMSSAANIAVAWGILGGVVVSLSPLLRRCGLAAAGIMLGIAAMAAWSRAFLPWCWGDWHGVQSGLGLHPGLWRAGVIAGVLLWASRRTQNKREPASPGQKFVGWIGLGAASMLVWCATSFEVARAARTLAEHQQTQLAAVSMWWGVLGMALIVAGFARAIPIARHVGLTLMALAAIKVVAYDLANVPAMWRVVSFLLLGLLMLGVALVYARLNTRASRSVPAPDDADMSGV